MVLNVQEASCGFHPAKSVWLIYFIIQLLWERESADIFFFFLLLLLVCSSEEKDPQKNLRGQKQKCKLISKGEYVFPLLYDKLDIQSSDLHTSDRFHGHKGKSYSSSDPCTQDRKSETNKQKINIIQCKFLITPEMINIKIEWNKTFIAFLMNCLPLILPDL